MWIRTSAALATLVQELRGAPEIALDTEADSLHHYPERLCLVQIAAASGTMALIDPLALADLAPLGAVFADPATLTVVHAGDNDLAALKRRHRFTFAAVFDTYIAARFLGVTELGLDALLARYLGVAPGRSRQRDDWSVRPLTAEQEMYALDDVRHLGPLRTVLLGELKTRNREAWVLEECAALARLVVPEKTPESDAYVDIKGARQLTGRGLAVLRELHGLRETLARSASRPPFKVLSAETLLELAERRPARASDLRRIRGCTSRVIERHGEAILAAIARGETLPESALPVAPRRPRPSAPSRVRRRMEALRAWRSEAARRLGLDPGVLLPGRLIERLAQAAPTDLRSLEGVENFRLWRVTEFGGEILGTLAPYAE
jgi:ribonuclease D